MYGCRITSRLRQTLQELCGNVIGVYITSPDYLGNIQDISGLSGVCREYDLPLAVDNAHGAYLNFAGTIASYAAWS